MVDRRKVLDELDRITDPCSQAAGMPIGLVAMGLVTEVVVEEGEGGALVRVAVGVTDPTCFMAVPFIAEAQRRIGALAGVRAVEVRVDGELDWTEDRMDPRALQRLTEVRRQRRAAAGSDTAAAT